MAPAHTLLQNEGHVIVETFDPANSYLHGIDRSNLLWKSLA
jgi:hypothetical protein